MTQKVGRILRATDPGGPDAPAPFDSVVLAHDERHIRRKMLTLGGGEKVLVDLPHAIALDDGDRLALEDGRQAAIVAAREALYEITARERSHLAELAWHIGNRHLPAQIEANRILILRDHVIKAMLEGLGATLSEVVEQFRPVRGAYSGGHTHHPAGHSHD